MKNLDLMTKEEILNYKEELKSLLKIKRFRKNSLKEELKVLKKDKKGYKWTWADEKVKDIRKEICDLSNEIGNLMDILEKVNIELNYFKKGESRDGKAIEIPCTVIFHDDNNYLLNEILNKGYIKSWKL